MFFDLYELFPAFICANNKKEWLKEGGLVNSFFGIKVSISVSVFCHFSFTISAIASCGSSAFAFPRI